MARDSKHATWHGFIADTHLFGKYFAILEGDHGGNAHYLEVGYQIPLHIHIDLANLSLAIAKILVKGIQNLSLYATRPAPCSPEINQHWNIGL